MIKNGIRDFDFPVVLDGYNYRGQGSGSGLGRDEC